MTQVLARALVRSGHVVRVVGVYGADYPGPDSEEDLGVAVLRIRERALRGGWLLARYELFRTVARWARRGEIDLVEGPDYNGWFAGWPRLPVPVVQRSNGSFSYFAHELGREMKRMMFRLERSSYRRSTAWAAVSRYTASVTAKLFGLRMDPLAILHNPVDVPDEMPPFAERSRNRVVFTGTLTAKKGVLGLMDAWSAVKNAWPSAELHVFGKDTRSETGRSTKEEMIDRLPGGLRVSVTFHGHVTALDLRRALSTARVGVFPSFTEAFALAPLESMGCGCPTISTSLGSGPEEISPEVDGLLVDPWRPAEIAGAIVRLLQDDPLAERLGAAGRAHVVDCFTIPALLPANETFFADCVRAFAS
jgi:glycosyltransferase involved in cell wall biosynthesis